MQIRDERPADGAEIRTLLENAFPEEPVGQLVDDLRAGGDLVFSLVTESAGEIAGYVAFSSVAMAPCHVRAAQLAPLAVADHQRRRGLGAALVRTGIERCRALDFDAILVLGDPAYYGRFGFDPAAAAHFRSRWSGPHLMALPIVPESLAGCTFFTLPPAFDRLP